MLLVNEKVEFFIIFVISKNFVCFWVDFQKESCNDFEECSFFVVYWDVEFVVKDNEWFILWLSVLFFCNKDVFCVV